MENMQDDVCLVVDYFEDIRDVFISGHVVVETDGIEDSGSF